MPWTSPRTWVTGELVTAAMLNEQVRDNSTALRGTRVRKASDQSVSNTTLTDATGFSFSLPANETWLAEVRAAVEIPGAPDGKFHWTVPSGATGTHMVHSATTGSLIAIASDIVIAGTGGLDVYVFEAIITNGATPGTVQFQFAQNSADASPVVMKADARLIAAPF